MTSLCEQISAYFEQHPAYFGGLMRFIVHELVQHEKSLTQKTKENGHLATMRANQPYAHGPILPEGKPNAYFIASAQLNALLKRYNDDAGLYESFSDILNTLANEEENPLAEMMDAIPAFQKEAHPFGRGWSQAYTLDMISRLKERAFSPDIWQGKEAEALELYDQLPIAVQQDYTREAAALAAKLCEPAIVWCGTVEPQKDCVKPI